MRLSQSTLPAWFEACAAADPDAVALLAGDRAFTYAELNSLANRLARALVARGVGPEDFVGIALPRTEEMIVALLAVLKAGAAYFPIDSHQPAGRVAFMVQDVRPKLVLTTSTSATFPPARADVSTMTLDDLTPYAEDGVGTGDGDLTDANLTDADRVAPLSSAHPIYVIYTSGSTGEPKGVVVTHANLVNLLTDLGERFGYQEALELFRHLTDPLGETEAHNGMGDALLATGDPTAAHDHFAAALDLAEQTGDLHQQSHAHFYLAEVLQTTGKPSQAHFHRQQALAGYATLGAPASLQPLDHAVTTNDSQAGTR